MQASQGKGVPALAQGKSTPRLGTSPARFAAALLIGGLALSANAFELPADGVYKDRIDWGLIMDITGPSAAAQVPWVYGFQDYMRKVNEAGGIHARKINGVRFKVMCRRVSAHVQQTEVGKQWQICNSATSK